MEPFNMYVITDTHYFSEKLGCGGGAHEDLTDFDQKCAAESQKANEAVVNYIMQSDKADIVLISGDLSFNGAKENHLEFTELLRKLKSAGKKVFVITAERDYNDNAFAFSEKGKIPVEGTKRDELFDLYYEFGFKDAISVDRQSLSYVAQLSPEVRLLALNNDGGGKNGPEYTARQMEWILEQTKSAREAGEMLIAMTHNPLLASNPIFSAIDGILIKNADNITELLAREGVHLCFSGHMHNQSIKMKLTEDGERFWDICTGSVIDCPAYMRLVTVCSPEKISVTSIPVPDFRDNTDGLSTEEYFKQRFDKKISAYIDLIEKSPEKFLKKFHIPAIPALVRMMPGIGRIINHSTVGEVCRLLLVKHDKSIAKRPVKELTLDLVRNTFTGNAPYVCGTPEADAILGILGKFKHILKAAGAFIKINGKKVDVSSSVRNTIGNYGLDEYETEIVLK